MIRSSRYSELTSHLDANNSQLNLDSRCLVVGLGFEKGDPYSRESLIELEELVSACGGQVVGVSTFHVPQKHAATLLGKGQVEEIGRLIEELQITHVVVGHTLSGVQGRNLSLAWKTQVLDRAQVILEIFAQRARTFEGKLQVELAQLLDQMPRMVNAWMGSLSRLGGGIGTRGPGETAIEADRRVIRKKVQKLKSRLARVRQNRMVQRERRQRASLPHFALIGYTNSGKSTLFNQLTRANVLTEDQVFATLDPTTRRIHLNTMAALVTDTVGFIRDLPPQLIAAFKGTLEESALADVLLHIVDLSNPLMEQQIDVVNQLILELGWQDKPLIHVFNKEDVAPLKHKMKVKVPNRVFVSALSGEGLPALREMMHQNVLNFSTDFQLFFSRGQEDKIFELARQAMVVKKEELDQGIFCQAKLNAELQERWHPYIVRR